MVKKIGTFILLFFTVLCVCGCSIGKKNLYTDIDEYENYLCNLEMASDFMPDIDSLSGYTNIEVNYFNQEFIWTVKTISLIVTYSETDYQDKKSLVISTFVFFDGPIYDGNGDTIVIDFQAVSDGYTIQVVNDDGFVYPKRFGMIGYSDTKYQIVYMYVLDWEISSISNLESYIGDYFILDSAE